MRLPQGASEATGVFSPEYRVVMLGGPQVSLQIVIHQKEKILARAEIRESLNPSGTGFSSLARQVPGSSL